MFNEELIMFGSALGDLAPAAFSWLGHCVYVRNMRVCEIDPPCVCMGGGGHGVTGCASLIDLWLAL